MAFAPKEPFDQLVAQVKELQKDVDDLKAWSADLESRLRTFEGTKKEVA